MNIRKKYNKAIIISILFLICSFYISSLKVIADSTNTNKNAQIIIKYKSDDKTDNLNIENIKMRKMLTSTIEVIEIEDSGYIDESIELLESNIDIEYAQTNYVIMAISIEDGYYYRQWGLKNNEIDKIDFNSDQACEII